MVPSVDQLVVLLCAWPVCCVPYEDCWWLFAVCLMVIFNRKILVVYRIGRKMENEDNAQNTNSWSSWYGQKVEPVCRYTMQKYCVLVRLFAHTDWISCAYLARYPRLPCCVLFYIQLIILCFHLSALFECVEGVPVDLCCWVCVLLLEKELHSHFGIKEFGKYLLGN